MVKLGFEPTPCGLRVLALQSSHSVHALNNYTKIYHYSHFDKTKVPVNLFSFPDSQNQWKNL